MLKRTRRLLAIALLLAAWPHGQSVAQAPVPEAQLVGSGSRWAAATPALTPPPTPASGAETPPANDTADAWTIQELPTGGDEAGLQGAAPPAAEGGWSFVELPVEQPLAPQELLPPLAPPPAAELPAGAAAAVGRAAPKPTGAAPEAEAPQAALAVPEQAAAPQYAAAAAPPRNCWVQSSTDFEGADLLPDGNTTCCASASDCCRECWATPGCGAWTFRGTDATCFPKHPAGWVRKPGQHGLTSGMVTAAAVQAFNATLAFSGGAGAVLRQERLEAAPLENTTKTWLPPPAGYPQGQCMVLPNSNAKGDEVRAFQADSVAACCDACAQERECDVWIFCGEQAGCTNGYATSNATYGTCGLLRQDLPPDAINEFSIEYWGRGSAVIAQYPPGYTVPYTSGYVLKRNQGGSSGTAGAIAGAVIGGLAAAALAVGLVWWRRRRKRQLKKRALSDNPEAFGQKLSAALRELDAAWNQPSKSPADSPASPATRIASGEAGAEVNSGPNDTAMGRGAERSGGLSTATAAGSSGPIPELPFAAALLSPNDFSIETDPATGNPVLLGSGHFANVYRGSYGMEPAAIKVIKEPGLLDRESLLREVAILKACRSQHLVSFLGASLGEQDVVIVTELLVGGTLWRAIKAGKVNWWRRGSKVAIDVLRGLDYLHRRSIIHLDLKSPNVLLTEHGRAKVADVGLARMVPNTQSYLTGGNVAVGTWPWAAPEQLFGRRCTTKADIYAFGVVLWEICTGMTPVRGHMRDVKVLEECPLAVADLITACMSSEPEDRPTAEQAIAALLPVVTAPPGSPPARGPATPAQRNNGVAGQASEGQQEQQQPQPQQMPPTSPVAAPAGGAALADSAMDVAAGQRQQHEGAAEGA